MPPGLGTFFSSEIASGRQKRASKAKRKATVGKFQFLIPAPPRQTPDSSPSQNTIHMPHRFRTEYCFGKHSTVSLYEQMYFVVILQLCFC